MVFDSKTYHREYMRKWSAEHPDKIKEYTKRGYKKNRKKRIAAVLVSREKHRDHYLGYNHERNVKKRTEWKRKAIEHYSNGTMRCADPYHKHLPNDPFLIDIDCLTLDHPKGDGAKERRGNKVRGSRYYLWLIKNNYPRDLQVLCSNCQRIKMHKNHEWPKTFGRHPVP